MTMNQSPSAVRARVALFGRANAGKSSLINAMTGQSISIVSGAPGTTTDPVTKAMELLPLGPVTLIDTAGLDDQSELGALRVRRSLGELAAANIVLFVVDAGAEADDCELEFWASAKGKPLIIVANKADESTSAVDEWRSAAQEYGAPFITVSARTGEGIHALRELIASTAPSEQERVLIRDLVPPGKVCVLVIPIDAGAPKGRLILPQQQVIRDLLEGGAIPVACRDDGYAAALAQLREPPALVVTDSQVFGKVAALTPDGQMLTSFSMLFARYKGELDVLTAGVSAIGALRDGDQVLIAEGCTHHRQCEDIGTVKIPKWLSAYTGKSLDYRFVSGGSFPDDLSGYKLIVHCGACMLTQLQMGERMKRATGVPMVNYGVLIAQMNGILDRCLAPLCGTAGV